MQKHAVNDTWGQRRQVGQRVALETAVAQKIDLSQFFKLGKNPYAESIFGEYLYMYIYIFPQICFQHRGSYLA